MKTVTYINLESIQPNPLNPRKYFGEAELNDLAESILKVGVLQPITVRTVENGYQVVCGERRLRASKIAGVPSIPAIIRKLTDDEAMDIAITENLQREEVDPFEEGEAFVYLINHRDRTIEDIAVRFGKSTGFVRGRMKLLYIIKPLRELYNEGKLSISHCLELSKIDAGTQNIIFNANYQEGNYNSWRGLSFTELKSRLKRYFTNFAVMKFNKAGCLACTKNLATGGLFPEQGNVACTDKKCAEGKEIDFRIGEIESKHEASPLIKFFNAYPHGPINEAVIKGLEALEIPILKEDGHHVHHIPEMPERGDDQTDEEFSAEMEEYHKEVEVFEQNTKEGNWFRATIITGDDFGGDVYLFNCRTKQGQPTAPTDVKIKELKAKDSRNKEIAEEKTAVEVREYVKTQTFMELSKGDLTDYEDQCLCYSLLQKLTKEQQQAISQFDDRTLSDTQCWEAVLEMTCRQKAYIIRCTILNQIGNRTGKDTQMELFYEWLNQREAGKVAEFELKHTEVYLRRKEGIDAQIAELTISEQ